MIFGKAMYHTPGGRQPVGPCAFVAVLLIPPSPPLCPVVRSNGQWLMTVKLSEQVRGLCVYLWGRQRPKTKDSERSPFPKKKAAENKTICLSIPEKQAPPFFNRGSLSKARNQVFGPVLSTKERASIDHSLLFPGRVR